MKINLTTEIRNINGDPIEKGTTKNGGEKEYLSIGNIMTEALMGFLEEDKKDSQEKKLSRYELARKIYGQDELTFSVEQLTMIKDRVNKLYPSPLIIGEVNRIIEGSF